MGHRVRDAGAHPIGFGPYSWIGEEPLDRFGSSVRIGRNTLEIAAILEGVAARLQPHTDDAEPVGTALQNQLLALTAALRGPDPRRAASALALARAMAIGRLVLASAREGVSASSADTMTLAVNLEAAEGILRGSETFEAGAHAERPRADRRLRAADSK